MRSFSVKQSNPDKRAKANTGIPIKTGGLPDLSVEPQGKMEREGSIHFLRNLLPAGTISTDGELDQLADCLGDLPFILNIAGGYLKERVKISVREYLSEMNKTASALDPSIKSWMENSPNAPSKEAVAVITMSSHLLEGKDERERFAQHLFFTAAACVPNLPIPFDLLRQGFEVSKNRTSNLDRSLQWLYSLGLLTQSEHGPYMNSTLAGFARCVNPEPARILTLLSDTLLNAPFEAEPGPYLFLLIGHLRAVAAQAEEAGLAQTGSLWNHLAYFLWTAKQLNEARICLERCLSFCEQRNGLEHADTATVLANLGRVHSDLGDLSAAKNCFERAMAINESVFSASYPEVASNANDLGQVLYDLGDLQGARTCFERALSIHENAFAYGPKHAVIAIESGNLGRVLRDLHDLRSARECFERALSVDEWNYGPKYPGLASRANYLGRVLYQLGDLQGAKTNFERAVAIEKADPNLENAHSANALNNLALVYHDLGNRMEARNCFEQVLVIDEKVHGPEHPTVAKDLASLGNIERELGNLSAARDRYARALNINEMIYGQIHPITAGTLKNLGRILYTLGDLVGAKEMYNRAVEIETRLLDEDHVEVGTDVHNLGMVLAELGELQEARACYERALEIFEKNLPPDHIKRIKAQQHLDRVKRKLRMTS